MTSLKSLAQTAMLGTSNGFTLPEEVAHLSLNPDLASDSEAGLLLAAAVIGIGEIGGRVPVQVEGGEAPCPAETRQPLSEHAAGLLKRMLAGEYEPVLPEFLKNAVEQGMLAPPETLPSLFGLDIKALRPLVQAVAGERGRWLAAQNPAWTDALVRPGEETWETGTTGQRLALLERTRQAAPDKARELVQSTWQQDAPEVRAAFLAAMSAGLSMEDEPFLETCLADGRKEVREAARALLMRLPESRFVARGVSRLEPLFDLKSRFLRGETLEVTLPGTPDPQAKKDGVGGAVLRQHMGEKTNWLAQMLSVVPPSTWTQRWNRPPEKLLQLALGSEWKEALLLGWMLAVDRCGDLDWVDAFAELWVRQPEARTLIHEMPGSLIRSIRLEQLEALAGASITHSVREMDDNHPLLDLLITVERPWSANLARTVMGSVLRQASRPRYRLVHALPGFALRIPPSLAGEFATGWPEDTPGWEPWINQFTATLLFRKEMLEAL
jgi:hypothetical protein